MKIPTQAELIEAIEKFLDKRKMKPHEFGKKYFNDSGFVPRLKEGVEPRLSTLSKVAKVIKGKLG